MSVGDVAIRLIPDLLSRDTATALYSNPSAFSYGEPEHRKRTARSDGDEDHWCAVRSPAT